MTVESITFGLYAGFAATLTMDVLGSIFKSIGLTAGPKGPWFGRWYLGIARGQFIHTNIADAPQQKAEKPAALVGHYAIGITLAVFYVVGVGYLGIKPGLFHVALGYGLATCVFPWFLVFPAFGFGAFGLKAPQELKLLRSSVLNHLLYGFGLWWITTALTSG